MTSDWLNGIYDGVKAANAGMDVEMPLAQRYGKKLKSAVVTALDGFRRLLGDSVKVFYTDGSDTALAARMARAADAVVLVVGYAFNDEGENIFTRRRTEATSGWGTTGDRFSLSLKDQGVALICSVGPRNPRTAVVLIGGSAIVTKEWKEAVPAILMAWYPGMEGGNAIARVVFGYVNPSGKLPFAVPKDAAQLPLFNPLSHTVTYGYYHGYTLFDRSRVERPKKLLRGLTKVRLEPGETKTVQLSVPVADLAWYDPDTRSWEVETIVYQIAVGASSRDKDLKTAAFRVVR